MSGVSFSPPVSNTAFVFYCVPLSIVVLGAFLHAVKLYNWRPFSLFYVELWVFFRMSYSPPINRPPIGIPQLPPGIPPPQYAGFAPPVPPGTPMIPVHMGVMTPAPTVLVPTTVTIAQRPVTTKKDPVLIRAKDAEDIGGPTTTVFVGNISEKASDMLVRQLLA
ncbi:hypothetical protein AMECASPLE_018708, partial [Ameca splendens]